jgi:ankyrin repeat protein
MNKSLSIFVFALFFHSFLYANPQQDLQQALAQLSSRLERLRSGFSKTAQSTVVPATELEIPILPYEMVHYITESIIPNKLNAESIELVPSQQRARLIAEQKKAFIQILQSIAAFISASKANREALSNPRYNKIIIKKLFALVNPYLLNNLKLPQKLSQDPTILGTIHNILYYISLLKYPPRPTDPIDKAIRYIVDSGVDPNFFVGSDTLLDKAIKNNLPDTVDYLIKNGADINLKHRDGELPFTIAFNNSLKLALKLSKNPTINVKLIENQPEGTLKTLPLLKLLGENIKIYEDIFNNLLDKGLSPNIKLKFYPQNLTLFDFFIVFGGQSLSIPLIQKMLDRGANINGQNIFVEDLRSYVTPLQYAEHMKNAKYMKTIENEEARKNYEELYELLKTHQIMHP